LPTVTSVSPSTVSADFPTNITIGGTGLDSPEATSLYVQVGEDAARLTITGQGPTAITAVVPPGLPANSSLPLRVLSMNGISTNQITLTVGASSLLQVTDVTPYEVVIPGGSKTFSVSVTGSGFTGLRSASLQRPGAPAIQATSVTVAGPSSLSATFVVTSSNAGIYDLCLGNPPYGNVVSDRKIVIYSSGAATFQGGRFIQVSSDTLYLKGSTISAGFENGYLVAVNNLLTAAPSISLDRSQLPRLGNNYRYSVQPDLYVGGGLSLDQLVPTTTGMEYFFKTSSPGDPLAVIVDFPFSPSEELDISYQFAPASGMSNQTVWITDLLTIDTTSETVTILPNLNGSTIRYSTLIDDESAGTAQGHIEYPGMIFDDPTDGGVVNGGLALTFRSIGPFDLPTGSDANWMRHDVDESFSRVSNGLVRHHFAVYANKRALFGDTIGPFVISAYGLSQNWSNIASAWQGTITSNQHSPWWQGMTMANSVYFGGPSSPPATYLANPGELTSTLDEVMIRAGYSPPLPYQWSGWDCRGESSYAATNFPNLDLNSAYLSAGSSIEINGGHTYPYSIFSAIPIGDPFNTPPTYVSCADLSGCNWVPCTGALGDTNGDGLTEGDPEFAPHENAMVFAWDDPCQRLIPRWYEDGTTPLQFNFDPVLGHDQMYMGLGDASWRATVEAIALNDYSDPNRFKWDGLYLDFLSGTMMCCDLGTNPDVEADCGCYHLIKDLQANLVENSVPVAIAGENPNSFLVNCGFSIGIDVLDRNAELDPRAAGFMRVEGHPVSVFILGNQCKFGMIADGLSPTLLANRHIIERFLEFRRGRLPGISYNLNGLLYHQDLDPETARSRVYVTEEGVWAAKNNASLYLSADADWANPATATILSVNGVKTVRTKTWAVKKAICDYFWRYGARAPTSSELSTYVSQTPFNSLAVYATACSIRDFFRRNPNTSPQTRDAVLLAYAPILSGGGGIFPGYPTP
jgi:IPT/TIG domain-containing protein